MNLHDRAEFEKQLAIYTHATRRAWNVGEVSGCECATCIDVRAKLHNARCDLVTWISVYTAQQREAAGNEALENSRRNSYPIHDTSGGN
jgi:hypothetical protein